MACSWLNLEQVQYLRVFQDPERKKPLDPHCQMENRELTAFSFRPCSDIYLLFQCLTPWDTMPPRSTAPQSPGNRVAEKVHFCAFWTLLDSSYSGCLNLFVAVIVTNEHLTQKPHMCWAALKVVRLCPDDREKKWSHVYLWTTLF
jgi:hypothetical protein